jgi:hypothetical protein
LIQEDNGKELQLITEGRYIDSIMLYVITARLLKPFKSWDAYRLGVIDIDGNKIKDPTNSKEKDSWSLLNRFLAKIKKMFLKHKLIGSLMTFYVLMKEDSEIEDTTMEYMVEQRQQEEKVKEIFFRLQIDLDKEGINEKTFFSTLANIEIKNINKM